MGPGFGPGHIFGPIDGAPIARVLAHPTSRPLEAGQSIEYQLRNGDDIRTVTVRVQAHPDFLGLLVSQQPDVLLVALAMLVLAAWLVRRRPEEAAPQAFLLFAAGWMSSALMGLVSPSVADYWARPWYVVWVDVGSGGYLVSGIATLLFAAAFPTAGRRYARRTWPAVALVPVVLGLALGAWTAFRGTDTGAFGVVGMAVELGWQACTLAALVVLAARYRSLRRDLEARRRIQIVVLGLAVTLGIVLLGKWLAVPAGTFGFGLVLLVFPASVTVALALRGLYELDLVLNRSLVALASGAVLLAVYLAVAAATAQLTRDDGPLVALPAAGLVAVAFAPVRSWVQRVVSRRLFGTADDPQLLLHRMGVRLQGAADPESLVAAVVDTAAESMRLPYAAIEIVTDNPSDQPWRVAHERGRRPAAVDAFAITVGDRLVGRLVAAPRRDAASLSPLDRRTLIDLARHSGVAAHVVALLTDLRVAQQRLLVAREEERHRIHRDLHDGIGPTLVGLTLQLEVAADVAEGSELGDLTRRLHGEAARATDDVRRMVRDLRPGELEELGLSAAVTAAAGRLSSAHAPRFDLDTPASLPQLGAAVEDAAYKICLEAMTNVIKHSGASRCTVRIGHAADLLELEVSDDGRGLGADLPTGTGLESMRLRAAALGGDVAITASGAQGGTSVVAHLPTGGGR
jgi:signal transduction histidine kinase